MADYISREAVLNIAYWHGDKADADHPYPDGVDAVDVSDIEKIPAADVKPVVRCRECIHFDPDDEDGLCCSETKAMLCPAENDFCSYGQRRDQYADVRKKE